MTWKRYGISLLNALISGTASSVSSFSAASLLGVNAATSLKIALVTALVSGAISTAKWLVQHPLPGAES